MSCLTSGWCCTEMLVSIGQCGAVKAEPALQEELLSVCLIHHPAECALVAQELMRALRREQSQGIDLDILLCSLNVRVTWESLLNYSPSVPLRFSQQLYRLLLSLFGLTRVEAAWEFVGKTKLCVGCVLGCRSSLGCRVFNQERRIRLARAAFAKSRQQNVSGTFSLLVWCSPAVQIQHVP